MSYKIELNTSNWYCECCGSGAHWDVTLYEGDKKLWGTSRNDQFGGTYRNGDDDTIDVHDYGTLIAGIRVALEALGHNVFVEEHIDDDDPYYDYTEDYDND